MTFLRAKRTCPSGAFVKWKRKDEGRSGRLCDANIEGRAAQPTPAKTKYAVRMEGLICIDIRSALCEPIAQVLSLVSEMWSWKAMSGMERMPCELPEASQRETLPPRAALSHLRALSGADRKRPV